MIKEDKPENELDPPPIAFDDPKSIEVLRVWASPLVGQQFTINPVWQDPGAFGLLLADIANHAANAYAQSGMNREEAFNRIVELFEAELRSPTDPYKEIEEQGN